MQLHAVHYGYDLQSYEAELQPHAIKSSESACTGPGCTSPECVCVCVCVYT